MLKLEQMLVLTSSLLMRLVPVGQYKNSKAYDTVHVVYLCFS